MLKIKLTAKAEIPEIKSEAYIRSAFTKKNMPKLYRYIQIATKTALSDKGSLPLIFGRTAFYDSDRQLTGKQGPHLISQFETRTEPSPDGVDLVVSNKKNVGSWNVFWMLTDGTRDYFSGHKIMYFFDRYGDRSHSGPGFRAVRFRKGNRAFVKPFNTWLEQRVQVGVDKGVQTWEMSGAAQTEFGKILKLAGLNVEF